VITSSCLCGEVAWEVEGPLELMAHCHCSMCRKAHGSAFGTYASVPEASFRWVRGRDVMRHFESSAGNRRPFCPRCGSCVAGEPHDGRIGLPVGNVDGDPGSRPLVHIFAASKAPWFDIGDALPQFDAFPPGFDEPSVDNPAPPEPTRPGALRGSCLCGEVVYEVSGQLRGIVQCHCTRCRKSRSAAHATNLFVASPQLEWISGRERVEHYALPDAEHFASHFCNRCGSLVPNPASTGVLLVPAGSIDTADASVETKFHIFTASKSDWYEICDKLPQFPERPEPRSP
jgi:hypothetical protein